MEIRQYIIIAIGILTCFGWGFGFCAWTIIMRNEYIEMKDRHRKWELELDNK